MDITKEFIKPVAHIRGGANPPHSKNTAESQTVVMPSPKTVLIPLQQHIGAPCDPLVKPKDRVYVGTKLGDSDKYVSVPVHSSVSGTVTKIVPFCLATGQRCQAVEIESDGLDELDPSIKPLKVNTYDQLLKAVRESGLAGLGGAGFPAHIKLTKNEDKPIDTLIINGAECEPFLTSDYRECIENADDILEGVYLLQKIMKFENVIIAVEDNKPKAIEILLNIAADKRDKYNNVRVMELSSHYPQGAEKVLIYTATGRKLPLGKLPADVGCIVMNITSVAFINRYIRTGVPLIKKRLTVDGDAVKNPQNVMVPVGTSVKEVLDFCGGVVEEPKKVLFGGAMMGFAIVDLNNPVLKQNNGILAFTEKTVRSSEPDPCIRCGRCASACPMNLQPAAVEGAMKQKDLDLADELFANYCMECGSCAFVCPAHRPLTQVMRLAKAELRQRK